MSNQSNFFISLLIGCLLETILHVSSTLIVLKINKNLLFKISKNILISKKEIDIYNFLKIRKWKSFLPEAGGLFKQGFQKKSIPIKSYEYLQLYIIESQRGEIMHIIPVLLSWIFLIIPYFPLNFIFLLFTLLLNIPLIMVLRFNKHRIMKILSNQLLKQIN